MGLFLVHNGFRLIILSNYWLLNMGIYRFDSRLSCAHFCLYCGKIIPIIEFYNSIMGLNNFEHGQNYLIMGCYLFENRLVNNTLWTYAFPMLVCPMGKLFWIMGPIIRNIELYYDDYGLIYFTLSTYVFSIMACPMGMIIRLWDK